ncbi:sce7726 family protein [Ruminiclostridium josui]|uniref:sce7726 family protein n=1 Tax=Ruminiclostridium josui TaxID=1499 RepID=UPI0004632C49|nr:sce7726 family protein [Ruminiclostridium josui]
MEELLSILESKYSLIELQKIATKLDKTFRLNSFWNGWLELEQVFYNVNLNINDLKSKYLYRDIYNAIIMKYGKTERIVKYYLTKEFINNDNEVCLYEFNVGNSRLDFGRINGRSYAYEIKTELDNTNRLLDQLSDYINVFEFINVVIHEKHLSKIKSLIPRNVGIIQYTFNENGMAFDSIRKPKENKNMKKLSQLEIMNTDDLDYIIKKIINVSQVPRFKSEKLKFVNKHFNKYQFNDVFKEAIKNKQSKKWKHIKDNFDMLKPIELQDAYIYEYDIKQLNC